MHRLRPAFPEINSAAARPKKILVGILFYRTGISKHPKCEDSSENGSANSQDGHRARGDLRRQTMEKLPAQRGV